MATETKSSVVRLKPSYGGDASASSSSVIKKRSVEIAPPKLSAEAKGKAIAKTEVNAKTTSNSSKAVTKTVTRTRQKKDYSLPGQKFDVPEEREPLRLFYESLSKQIPSSQMAEFWLMEHGLLSPERAKRAFEKKHRKQKQVKTGTPTKPPPRPVTPAKPPSRPLPVASSKKPQQAQKNGETNANNNKRVKSEKDEDDDDDDDDNVILSQRRRKG
ncbi:unnamed protein product [Cuscuta campestris]|uniref:Uncharacterized protein n=1 Tax=Cuscuta campestris TaxID=132261 RepID=A0A484LA98_9ASTE|nr:unnamed protein product [Cuscuta campestris]